MKAQVHEIQRLRHTSFIAGPDTELTHVTGGVGLLYIPTHKATTLAPITKASREIHKHGRVMLSGIPLPSKSFLVVASIYGWRGGHNNYEACTRTSDLLDIVLVELKQYPDSPSIILGDLNLEPSDAAPLQDATDEGTYADLGNHQAFHHAKDVPTCHFSPDGPRTRRDFRFATHNLLLFISCFDIQRTDLPVPSNLNHQLAFSFTDAKDYTWVSHQPFHDCLTNALRVQLDIGEQEEVPRERFEEATQSLATKVQHSLDNVQTTPRSGSSTR